MGSLIMGGIGFLTMYFATPNQLKLCFVLIGFSWGSILSMPYAMLSSSVDPNKMGIYGNIQHLHCTSSNCRSLRGYKRTLGLLGQAINSMLLAGISLIIAAFSNLLITNPSAIRFNPQE